MPFSPHILVLAILVFAVTGTGFAQISAPNLVLKNDLESPSLPPSSSALISTTMSTQPTNTFQARPAQEVVTNRLTPEGVGIYVRRSVGSNPRYFSPFALLDHFQIEEGSLQKKIGFHPHPHRGISTLTYIRPNGGEIVDNGAVQHKDSTGRVGTISPGDIQYMSAGKGIVHSEMPAPNPNGGLSKKVDGLQLWINLRAKDKMSDPEYQEYQSHELPVVERDGITAKVVMGSALGANAKVRTKTPVHYIHFQLEPNTTLNHPVPPHWNSFLYAFSGSATTGGLSVSKLQTLFFDKGHNWKEAEKLAAEATATASPLEIDPSQGVSITSGPDGFDFILVAGEPFDEPVIQSGPVIVNSREQLYEFYDDLQNSKNGFEGYQRFASNWRP